MAAIGVKDNERNISNKIARGSFTAVFFVQCMEAIGCDTMTVRFYLIDFGLFFTL